MAVAAVAAVTQAAEEAVSRIKSIVKKTVSKKINICFHKNQKLKKIHLIKNIVHDLYHGQYLNLVTYKNFGYLPIKMLILKK